MSRFADNFGELMILKPAISSLIAKAIDEQTLLNLVIKAFRYSTLNKAINLDRHGPSPKQ